ncbi:MAG: PhzF family phenazine biosynthesis protein [Actinomycetota bacterium]
MLRVFVGRNGGGGNPLGVFLAGGTAPAKERQRIATDLGFSETVFVDDTARAEMRIFTPAAEIPFAGHPSVGTAWLLHREGHNPSVLRPPAGEVGVRREAELTFIAARPEWAPPIDFRRLDSPDAVEALAGPPDPDGFTYCWAWSDEGAGEVRARSFPAEYGIAEDEATGAAAIVLVARLGLPITILQGAGSELIARPLGDGSCEVGGRVELDEVRDYLR